MGRRVRGWTVKGPLAPWAAGFECWLLGRGYLPSAVFHRLWLLAAMSLWLERQGLEACELTEQRGMLFVAERRAAGLKTWASEQSVRLPLAYLREVAAIPLAVVVLDDGPVAEILAGYREYLVLERGLAQSTIDRCQRAARLFLEQLPDEREINELTAADVSAFLARECPRLGTDRIGREVADVEVPAVLALPVCRGACHNAAGVGGAAGRDPARHVAAARAGARRGRSPAGQLRSTADGRAAGLRDPAVAGSARIARQ